jgi:hypothetical protein
MQRMVDLLSKWASVVCLAPNEQTLREGVSARPAMWTTPPGEVTNPISELIVVGTASYGKAFEKSTPFAATETAQ